jgi:flagellar biosynthetic protein FliR
MTILSIPLPQLQALFLIFLRVSAIIMTAPLFDNKSVPLVFKVGMGFALSIVLYSLVPVSVGVFQEDVVPFFIGSVSEILLGVAIGLSVKLVFSGIQLAGQLAGFQMGFAIANVVDTVSNAQVSIIAQLKNIVAMLIFLSVNAHYYLLQALVESFELVPIFDFQASNSLIDYLMKLTSNMFVIAIKVGAPIVVALLLTSVALGLVARTVPQMNIFIVAFPVKIAVGLLFLGLTMPFVVAFIEDACGNIGGMLHMLIRQAG